MMNRTYLCLAVAVMLLATVGLNGCRDGKPRRFAKPKPPDFRKFGELPGLAKSADASLVDELSRLHSEEATPVHLARQQPKVDVTAIMNLRDDLPAQRVTGLLEDIAKIYPRGRFVFSAAAEQRALDLLEHESALLDKAIAEVDKGSHVLVDHNQGLLADLHIFDIAELAHRGQALRAHAAMIRGDVDAAIQTTAWLLTLDHRLATLKGLVPRLNAARLRLEALRVVEAVVQDQAATDRALPRFRELLQTHLADWPADAEAWISDRAQGLHTYEMIRHGLVLSVFTDEELKALSEEVGVSATAKAIVKEVDADERFYLATIRRIIGACEQPYYQRRELLNKISDELEAQRGATDFPIVAGRILLVDLTGGHRLQAKDRAACEGWLLAMNAACGAPSPGFVTNPETGTPYQLQPEAMRIVLKNARAGEPDEALVVPIIGSPTTNAQRPLSPTTNRAR